MAKSKPATVQMRIRVHAGDRMLGPGKAELLAHVSRIGSLSGAAKKMGMSYMRAWSLVQELNRNSKRPMIALSRGGTDGGTARVTPFGKKVLALYQRMEKESRRVAGPYARKLARLLERV